MNRLEGKVAIITGGNSGVGAATAQKFAAEGAKVVITARREAQLEEVAAKIREAGGEVLPVVSDISKAEDAKRVLAATLEAFGKVDILINNAALWRDTCSFVDSTTELWKRYLDINIMSVVYCTRAALADMMRMVQTVVGAEDNDGNRILLQVLSHAVGAVGEFQQFAGHALIQTGYTGDAVANQDHDTGLVGPHFIFVIFNLVTDDFCDFFGS